jgi:hypothetical protein
MVRVRVTLNPGSTMAECSATVAVLGTRPEVRGRRRRGTVRWSPTDTCVNLPGSSPNERLAIVDAVARELMKRDA